MSVKIPKLTVILWQIRTTLVALLLAGLVFPFRIISSWFYICPALIVAAGCVMIFWYIPKYFRGFELRLERNGIIVYCGVILKTAKIMPFPRLIYIKSYKTPLSAAFGLEGLSLKAARGLLIVPELLECDVKKILEEVGEEREEDL